MLNLKKRIADARQNDEGFTLIELAVVILIIGILLALALPAFLGVRKSAQYKSAQSATRTAVVTAKGLYADTQSYVGVQASLQEPGYTYSLSTVATPTNSTGSKEVAIFENATFVIAASRSQDRCYATIDDQSTVAGTATGTTVWYRAIGVGFLNCTPPTAVPTGGGTPVLTGWTNVPVG
jgi:type IV pilus assembly protein PilA